MIATTRVDLILQGIARRSRPDLDRALGAPRLYSRLSDLSQTGAGRLEPAAYRQWPQHLIDNASFEIGYAQQLAALDPERVWHELHALAAPAEPIILCWELPGQPCHRLRVARWLEEQLGVSVPELSR